MLIWSGCKILFSIYKEAMTHTSPMTGLEYVHFFIHTFFLIHTSRWHFRVYLLNLNSPVGFGARLSLLTIPMVYHLRIEREWLIYVAAWYSCVPSMEQSFSWRNGFRNSMLVLTHTKETISLLLTGHSTKPLIRYFFGFKAYNLKRVDLHLLM